MRRYILLVNASRVKEFEDLFLNKTYVKYYSRREFKNGDLIYILTIWGYFKELAEFYNDTKFAKKTEIIYFVGCEMLEEE